jgi:hypothetical protein
LSRYAPKGGNPVTLTRRNLISTLFAKIGAVAILASVPYSAMACLCGTWFVRCPNGHVDQVDKVTCQHECEKCGAQAFSGGDVTVVCPNGHDNRLVNTGNRDQTSQWASSLRCRTCGAECRQNGYCPLESRPKSRPDVHDHK